MGEFVRSKRRIFDLYETNIGDYEACHGSGRKKHYIDLKN
jgi:hypothetical protein